MANFFADIQTIANGPAAGQPLTNRAKANKMGGRLRFMEAFFVVPAAALAIGDKIFWGKMPLRSRIVGHLSKIYFTAGAASSTINLGDNVVPARHLAASVVAAAGALLPEVAAQVQSATVNTVAGSNILTIASSLGAFQVGGLVAGPGIAANSVITGVSGNTVTLNNAATTTFTPVGVAVTGPAYETTDDTNSVANNFGSAADDCTLVSTVAGAALAAGQVFTLKIAYVQD